MSAGLRSLNAIDGIQPPQVYGNLGPRFGAQVCPVCGAPIVIVRKSLIMRAHQRMDR